MQRIKFTELEILAIKGFASVFNYRNADDEKADNATAINAVDIAEAVSIPVNRAKGAMGSLAKKGLLVDWNEPDMRGLSHITDKGIDTYYKLFG